MLIRAQLLACSNKHPLEVLHGSFGQNISLELRFKTITKLEHSELDDFKRWLFEQVKLAFELETKPLLAENIKTWISKLEFYIGNAHSPSVAVAHYHQNFEIPRKQAVLAFSRVHKELANMLQEEGQGVIITLAVIHDTRVEYSSLIELVEAGGQHPDATFELLLHNFQRPQNDDLRLNSNISFSREIIIQQKLIFCRVRVNWNQIKLESYNFKHQMALRNLLMRMVCYIRSVKNEVNTLNIPPKIYNSSIQRLFKLNFKL